MLERVLMKDISKTCGIKEIREGGYVLLDDKLVEIYYVEPIDVFPFNDETLRTMADALVSAVRGLPDVVQVTITKTRETLGPEIELYKKKLLETESVGLKIAIQKYIDYLEELEKDSEMYNYDHYLISNVDEGSKEIEELFVNLKKYGLNIRRITDKSELENIFRKAVQ